MISDVLFDAADQIRDYLKHDDPITGMYVDEKREEILKLVAEMDRLRKYYDTPPSRKASA
jgi:hypothetical protein